MQFHRRTKAPRILYRTWKANAFGPYTRQRFYRSLLWGPQSLGPSALIVNFIFLLIEIVPREESALVHVLWFT